MKYPVILHKEEESDYGATVPDFPGVFSGGVTLEETLDNIQEAIETSCEGEDGFEPPIPSSLDRVLALEEAQGGAVAFADVNFDFLDKKAVPVNITMPAYMRNRIDAAAKSCGLNRSKFLQRAAQMLIDAAR
jgi:Uncharacterized conserved protein